MNRPQSDGIVERLHRTLLDEHFRIEGRRTWFETIDEMQAVLDTYLDEHFRIEGRRTWFETIDEMQAVFDTYLDGYNHRRPHQGRGMNAANPRPGPSPTACPASQPRRITLNYPATNQAA